MPMDIEKRDNINTDNLEVVMDDGRVIQASSGDFTIPQVPNGITVNGVHFGGNPIKKPPQKPLQSPQKNIFQMNTSINQQDYSEYNDGIDIQLNNTPKNINTSSNTLQQQAPTEMVMLDGEYHLFVDLPGVQKEKLKIKFNNSYLTISGVRESNIELLRLQLKKPRTKSDPIIQSHSTIPSTLMNAFSFKYQFQKMVDETSISAEFNDGILHIILPHRTKGNDIEIAVM